MYDDIGDYIPDVKRRSTTHMKDKHSHENEHRKKVYFHHDSKTVSYIFELVD
jgi:hypothetical protein